MSTQESRMEYTHLDLARALDMMGEEQEVRDILQLAEESLRQNLPKLRGLVQAGQMVEAAEVLHVFKGMLPVFCADPLAELVATSERTAKTGAGLPDYPEVDGKLEQLLHEIRTYLGLTGFRK